MDLTNDEQTSVILPEESQAKATLLGTPSPLVRIAVYDFDGTSISGNSPVLLVRHLVHHKKLSFSVTLRILLWGLAYKLRLPQNESWARSLVFRAFEGMPKAEVDDYLATFYDEHIAYRFREMADASMKAHREEGTEVVVVSATFEPIIKRAMEHHPFDQQVSTRMVVDESGCYTCAVEGLPVEGAEKVAAITRYADERFGKGAWELSFAYGDHHSDTDLLKAAKVSFAVCPDNPLARRARKFGWTILNWTH